MALGPRARILVGFALLSAALAAFVWVLSAGSRPDQTTTIPLTSAEGPRAAPPADAPPSSPTTPPAPRTADGVPAADMNRPGDTPSPSASQAAAPEVLTTLLIPVEGVGPDQLSDSFYDARPGGGKHHNAIDIFAKRGTPVLAAADGTIVEFSWGELGGNVIYQLSTGGEVAFYYAHLDRYAEGLHKGKVVRMGDVIGYVGDTGSPEPGEYHLHFSVSIVTDPGRYEDGIPVNPYPLLRDAR